MVVLVQGSGRTGTGWRSLTSSNTSPPTTSTPRPPPPSSSPSPLSDLHARLRAATLDTGDHISAGTARRLACTAGLIPAVLGGPSLPLDLGRRTRLFTDTHRIALATRYTSCAATGCDRPYAWTELHHRDPWSHGGPTNLDHAVPLCRAHHTQLHTGTLQHTLTQDPTGRYTLTFHPRP